MDLDTSLEELSWIPRPRILALRRLALETVGDLLRHYPRRHEDRREFRGFPSEETIGPVCLCGEVTKTRLMRFGGRKIFEAVLEESGAHALSQPLTCRWFNLHYIQKMIATGQQLVVFGRVKRKGPRLLIDHPEFEVIEDDEEILIHFRRITPIYPATEGLSQRVLRGLIFRLLEQVEIASADVPLPASLSNGEDENALRKIHFPESDQQYTVLRSCLDLLGIRIALRTGARQEDNAPLPLFARAESESLGSAKQDSAKNVLTTRAVHASASVGSGSARVSRVGDGVTPSQTFPQTDETPEARYSRRRLPHFEKPWAIYAVTIGTKKRRCFSPKARTIALDTLRYFHNKRYELFAACVMPDHVHFLIQPWPKENDDAGNVVFWSLKELLHSIKSYSAHAINKAERERGGVWEKERFDRYIRSQPDLIEKFEYILWNP